MKNETFYDAETKTEFFLEDLGNGYFRFLSRDDQELEYLFEKIGFYEECKQIFDEAKEFSI